MARFDIPVGTCFPYSGPFCADPDASDYSFLCDETNFSLDGQSVLRFANYYRGFAESGNVTFVSDVRYVGNEPVHVVFGVVIEPIQKGALVLMTSYERDYDTFLNRISMGGEFVSFREASTRPMLDPFKKPILPVMRVRDVFGTRTFGPLRFYYVQQVEDQHVVGKIMTASLEDGYFSLRLDLDNEGCPQQQISLCDVIALGLSHDYVEERSCRKRLLSFRMLSKI